MAENSHLDQFAAKYGLSGGKPASLTSNPIQKPVDNTEALGNFLVERTRNAALSLQDGNEYSRISTFDNSPTGAFKDRYKAYGQDTYNRIGFDPLINNEQNFTKQTTTFDDAKRWLTSAALPMAGLGFMDPLNSYKDAVTGNMFKGNTDTAKDYEYYNMLGYSSRGGVGGFGVNLLNSFSYSAGIMIEGAIEGAIIGAAVGAAGEGVGAIPGAAIGGLVEGVSALTKVPRALFQTAKTIGNMGKAIKGLTAVNSAKNVWNAVKTGGASVGKILNPLENTTEAMLNLSKWKDIDNLTGLARASRTAGAFWHDMMSINMALSEGKLEGGMTELHQYDKLYNEHYAKYGKAPDEDTQRKMVLNAREAGIKNTMANTGLIFVSNKIAFPSLTKAKFLKGLPSLNAGKVVGTVGKEFQLVVNNADDISKVAMEKVPITFKNSLKGLTSPRKMGSVAVNYFKANLIEGLQEVGQDALSSAVEDYYTKAFYNPAARSYRMGATALYDGLSKQSIFSETFLSGFAMGTLLQGPSKLVKHGSRLGNRIFKSKDTYDQYMKEKTEEADRIVNTFNSMTKDNVKHLFNPSINSYASMSLLAKNVDNPDDTTTKQIKDDGSAAFGLSMLASIKNGTFDMYMDHIKNYKSATPEEIEEAWNLEKGQGQKALDNLDQAILNAQTIKNRFEFAQKRYKPAILKEKFESGTEEYRKAQIYENAYLEGLSSFVFMQSSFDDTLNRLDKLYNLGAKFQSLGATPFSNFAVLTNDANRLDREIEMLKTDIESGSKSTEPQTQQEVEQKRKLLSSLFKFQEVQNKLTTSLFVGREVGMSVKDMIDEMKNNGVDLHTDYSEAFLNVLNTIADTTGNKMKLQDEIEKNGGFDELYQALFDTHLLAHDRNILSDYINILNEPTEFYEHVERNFEWMKKMYDNRKELIKELVNQEFEIAENNEVLVELAQKGIYVDLNKFADWVENKKRIPDEFIDVTNNMIINKSSVLYPEYERIFIRAANATRVKPAGDPLTEKQKLDSKIDELKKERADKLNALREAYEQQFLDEVGKPLNDVEYENEDAKEKNAKLEETKKTLADQITLLNNALETLNKNNPIEINKAVQKLVDNGVISAEELNDLLTVDGENPDVVAEIQAIVLRINTVKGITEPELLAAAVSVRELPEVIADKILENNDVLKEQPIELFDIEGTKAFQVYTEGATQINNEYDKYENEVKQDFANRGINENTPDSVTTSTPYENMPDELKASIDAAFDQFLIDTGDNPSMKSINPVEYERQRSNWIELNGAELINAYNEKAFAEAKARAEKLKEPPFLKYNKKQVSKSDTVSQLNALYKVLNNLLTTGKDADGNEVKLSDQQKADLKEDLENLAGYLDALAKAYKPKSVAQKVVDIIQERILNRRGEVEDVVDAEGRKTRKFAGEETTTDIEAKKADIERRRQEELISGKLPNVPDYIKEEIERNVIQEKEYLSDVLRLAYDNKTKSEIAKELNIDKEVINSLRSYLGIPSMDSKTEFKEWKSKIDKINAKYDAELAALDEPTEGPVKLRRVSEIASKIAKEKLNFEYNYNKKPLLLKRFESILENETDKDKAVTSFMALLKKYVSEYKQFDSKRKLDAIEAGLRKNPTVESLGALIDEYAFIESTEAGTKVDELIRKFLTLDSVAGEGFTNVGYEDSITIAGVNYKVSDFMSRKAFDRLFGPGGIVSSIRSKMIDGEFVLFPENLLVFDKTLGITGEIDLLAVNPKGEVMIIDIKTSKNWDTYEKDNSYKRLSHRAQLSIYSTLFYNMTGIKPNRLAVLPLGIDVDVEGYVKDIDKAKVPELDEKGETIKIKNPKTGKDTIKRKYLSKGYYDLEFLDDITEEGVVMIQPEFETELAEEIVGEEGTEETPSSETILEETNDFDNLSLTDLLNKTIIFNGTTGKLIMLEDGSFAVEKTIAKDADMLQQMLGQFERDFDEETNPEIKKQIGSAIESTKAELNKKEKVIEVVYHKGKPATNGALNGLDLGISIITGITFPFQVNKVNGRVIKAEFTNEDETSAVINGVRYDVIRDKSGAIAALSYRRNESYLNEIDEEIDYANSEISRLSQLAKPKDIKKSSVAQFFLLNKIAELRERVQKLEKDKQSLLDTNDIVLVKGGNSNDYIFALNALPNSFQKATKSFKPQDEKKHLKEIDRLSLSSAVSKAITEIVAENYPDKLDTLFDKGVSAISELDLTNFYYWIDQTVDELYALSSTVINREDLVDDISNQINALLQLKNDLNLIKIIKDGKTKKPRFSKQQAAANKIFGTNKVQKRTGVPKNEKSVRRQAETVSGLSGQRETISTEELKDLVSNARSVKPTVSIKTSVEPAAKPTSTIFNKIESAKTEEELKQARDEAYNKRGDVKISEIDAAYTKRLEELQTLSINTIKGGKEGTLLITKKPIFDMSKNVVVRVSMIIPSSNQIVVTVEGSNTKKTLTEEQLQDSFIRYTKEAMEKSSVVEPVTETQKEKAVISKSSITELGTNPELLNKAKQDAKKDSASRFSALKQASNNNNINNCD